MENKTLEAIPKFIGVFTSLLILLGIISSVVYYRAFNINILDHITIGESLLLFIAKFSPSSISVVLGVFLSKLFLESHNEEPANQKKVAKFKKQMSNPGTFQKLYALFVILPLSILAVMGFSPFEVWAIALSLIVRIYIVIYLYRRLRIITQIKKIEDRVSDYFLLTGISLITLVTIAMAEAYLVYGNFNNKSVTLFYSDGIVLTTNSNTLYLGKSQLFYYLYDKPNEKAIIIKSDLIDRVEIKKL